MNLSNGCAFLSRERMTAAASTMSLRSSGVRLVPALARRSARASPSATVIVDIGLGLILRRVIVGIAGALLSLSKEKTTRPGAGGDWGKRTGAGSAAGQRGGGGLGEHQAASTLVASPASSSMSASSPSASIFGA